MFTGPFSTRFSPCLPGPSTPSPLAGEGGDGGEKHGLGTPPTFTPTLTLPRLRGREKTDRHRSRKLNDPDYVYGKGFRTQKRRRDAGLQSGPVAVRKVYFMHAVTSDIP